jgi:hypothetical protein
LFLLLCALPYVGAAQTLPPEVLNAVSELDEVCSDHGGRPGGAAFVEHAVIGSDQLEVWILDDGRYNCKGSVLWPGNWGSGVRIYARLSSGNIKMVFDATALEASIQSESSSSRIWIHGWGEMCGLPEPENDDEWAVRKTCQRPLNWDGRRKKMIFAPLSDAHLLK